MTSHRRSPAFSLVELLVVLAVTAILAAITIPQISATMQSYQLTSTGQTAINQLVLARQSALSGSHAVQVRFYYLPENNATSPSTAPLAVYRGMQSFTENNPSASGRHPHRPDQAVLFQRARHYFKQHDRLAPDRDDAADAARHRSSIARLSDEL